VAFEYLGGSGGSVSPGVNILNLYVDERVYALHLYLDSFVGQDIQVDIENEMFPDSDIWRRVWTSGEFTVEAAIGGNATIPALAIPPWPNARNTRMVFTVATGAGGNLDWESFGL
jgi:hypothetical protein